MKRLPPRHEDIEDDTIDRIAGFQKIARDGTVWRRANVVVCLKAGDNHIPNVTVIIDDENMLRLAPHRSDTRGKLPRDPKPLPA
jgi:hypothetical protein